jgi:hypothetical protein
MTAPRRRRGVVLLAAASLMATAACGSTVQSGGQESLGAGQPLSGPVGPAADGLGADGLGGDGLGGDGLDGGAGEVPGAADGVVGVPDGASNGSASDPTGGEGQAAAPPGSSSGATTQAPSSGGGPTGGTVSGPGVTAKEIKLGIPYCRDCSSANAAVGAGGQDAGDERRYFQAALDDVNARGGVLGRKLVPVFHAVSVSDNIDQSAQEACETFTKDNEVAAIFLQGKIAAECGRKAGVVVMGAGGSGRFFDSYPNVFAPATIRLEGLYAATVRAMVKAGWHKPTAPWPTGKIGLITWDDNEYKYAMDNGYLRALREAGLKETLVRYIAVPQNANALADASAAISNAVLAFRQQGIDHVFIGDGGAGIFKGAGLTFLFLQNAESQGYRPRYGFNSNNAPDFEAYPAEQQIGMLAIDSRSTEPADDEGIAPNAQRERCFAVMRKRGLNVGDPQTQGVALNACEPAWFFEAIATKAGGTTLSQVIPAGESLGTSYRSPFTYGSRFSAGRHDGVYLFRNSRFDEGCECMKFTSKPYAP